MPLFLSRLPAGTGPVPPPRGRDIAASFTADENVMGVAVERPRGPGSGTRRTRRSGPPAGVVSGRGRGP